MLYRYKIAKFRHCFFLTTRRELQVGEGPCVTVVADPPNLWPALKLHLRRPVVKHIPPWQPQMETALLQQILT